MESHQDMINRLAAACDRRRWCSQAARDARIARLAAACDWWRRALVPRDTSCWSMLLKEVLDQVICRLPTLNDRLRFAAVCHHWHAVERRHAPYSLPKVCLALSDGSFFTFEPGSSSVLNYRGESLSRGHYRGACGSQLLCDSDAYNVYSLVNPFTLRKRRLPAPSGFRVHEEDQPAPQEDGFRREEMPVRKLVVCSDSGLVAAIVGHERSARVALCEPEVSWSWFLSAHNPWNWYADMVFFNGKLYALTNDEDLLALEVGHDEEYGHPRISRERAIEGADNDYPLKEYTRMRYLVVRPHGGGLLMVCRIMLNYGSSTYGFAVFEADLPSSSRWVEVYTLTQGDDKARLDQALFVSRLCSKAVSADGHGLCKDHIFYLDDSAGMEGPGVRACCDGLANVFNMKDGSVSELLPMEPYCDKLPIQPCSWDKAIPVTWLFSEDLDSKY